jgi:predicted nucleic acid-binding protein
MKVVVDTNILFSFFWKNSLTRKLLLTSNFELISPIFALDELQKYSKDIIKKTNITKKQFDLELSKLQEVINFIKRDKYSYFLKNAENISPDKFDADFFALCLNFDCFLWSNDSVLKNQDKIKVFSTEEIIEIFL